MRMGRTSRQNGPKTRRGHFPKYGGGVLERPYRGREEMTRSEAKKERRRLVVVVSHPTQRWLLPAERQFMDEVMAFICYWSRPRVPPRQSSSRFRRQPWSPPLGAGAHWRYQPARWFSVCSGPLGRYLEYVVKLSTQKSCILCCMYIPVFPNSLHCRHLSEARFARRLLQANGGFRPRSISIYRYGAMRRGRNSPISPRNQIIGNYRRILSGYCQMVLHNNKHECFAKKEFG